MRDALEAIRERRREWVARLAGGDADALADLLTDDAVWVPPHQAAVAGAIAVRDWLRPFFESYRSELTTSDVRVRIAGDRAVERGRYTSNIVSKQEGEALEQKGSYILLWRREPGATWKIERYIDITFADAP